MVRVRIESIPLPDSGYRCGDVVLHDGAAVGHRKLGDQQVPVFNVLGLFETSGYGTFEAEVQALCRQCSEGVPHDHDGEERPTGFVDRHVVGIATHQPDAVEAVLQRWHGAGRSVPRFERMLAPPLRH